MTSGSILMTAVGHGISKPLNDYGWEQNNKIRKFCEQQNLRKNMDLLNAAAFFLADALFCMFLFHNPSVFMDIIIFELSISSNLFEVVQ